MRFLSISASLFTALLLIFSLTSFAFAQKKGIGKGGVPKTVEQLKAQIADLQSQIDTIELIEGPPGQQGEQGIQGIQGEQGPKGDKGDKGDTGLASTVPGPKGEKGDPGATGATGARGPQGIQGVAGATGSKGEQGPPGVIEPGFYEGLIADQVDGLHASEIIEAATSGSGSGNGTYQFVGVTSTLAGGFEGVGVFSAMCNSDFPGSRFCNSKEIIESINPIPQPLSGEAWVHPSLLFSAGGASGGDSAIDYSGRAGSYYKMSCSGWAKGGDSGLSIYGQGSFRTSSCSEAKRVACCKLK